MERVTGIGGVFFRARDPESLTAWYERHLGVAGPPASYEHRSWEQASGPTVFAPFPGDSSHFRRPEQQWAINFRVRDLDAMVLQLRAAGIEVEVHSETYPNGRFADLADPEGNPVQLWEPAGADRVAPPLRPFELAFPGPLRDQLVAAVLSGEKTSTTGLLVEYEVDGSELPRVGERFVVIDSTEQPVAVVETTHVRVLPVGEIDLQHAIDEGEGYTTVAQWRATHEKFWHSPEMRTFLGDPNFTVDDTTMAVAERFRLVTRVA